MPASARPESTRAATVGCAALAIAVAGSQLLVDPAASAAFDAPKRLVALVGVVVAAIATAALPRPIEGATPRGRVLLAGAALAGAMVAASAFASPRSVVAFDALRTMGLLAMAIVLGASRLLDDGRQRWIAGAFVGGAVVNALVTCLERLAGWRPFAVEATAGRGASGAFVGNEGQLALVLALAAVAVFPLVTVPGPWSGGAAALLALLVIGAGLNGNLTAVLALLAGIAVVLGLRFRRQAVLPLAGAATLAIGAVAGLPPLRARAVEIARHVHTGDWDAVTSNRLGPWAAATEMVRDRPWLGFGPGTFGAEFVPHRLAAEMRWRTRLDMPVLTSSYAEAHCEPLQAFAEWGIVAGGGAIVAVLGLLWMLLRSVMRAEAVDVEGLVLAGFLTATVVAALTWFPFQQVSTRLPVLLALGRAWRRWS